MAGDTDYHFHQGLAGTLGAVRTRLEANYILSHPQRLLGIEEEKPEEPADESQMTAEEKAEAARARKQEADRIAEEEEREGRVLEPSICAPQLLHASLDGRPLWFNGWLQLDKGISESYVNQMNAFILEPEIEPAGAWRIGSHNVFCLQAPTHGNFTAAEREAVEMMIKTGIEVGALRDAQIDKTGSIGGSKTS